LIPNALDLEQYSVMPIPNSPRAEILGVGSLLPVKRWDRAIEAARELKNRGYRFRIRIAGGGPLRTALEARARDLEVSDAVEFLGHRADVARLLGAARFLVHTSDNEGCPNSVMEAMACGRAVVATDAGDVPVLVEEGKTGFVARRGDAGTLVQKLADLIDDENLCRRMGEAGRARAERKFGIERMVGETLAAYRSAGWREQA
jgi:glycosyltransferase involved in cell wall biosynthesis